MKKIARTVLAAIAVFMLNSPAMADGAISQVNQATIKHVDVPQGGADRELASRSADFAAFVKKKVRQLNSNHRFSRSRMAVARQADGTYRARYHEIDDSTLNLQVRRSQSSSIPFVGVLSYREQVFEGLSSIPDRFDQNSFTIVEIIPNRHIFSYRQGSWN